MTMTMKICLLPQIFTVSAKQMQDINASEKASNSNLPLIIYDITHRTTVTMIQLGPDFAFTNDTTYLALMGKLWGVFHEMFKEIWPRYIESALYSDNQVWVLGLHLLSGETSYRKISWSLKAARLDAIMIVSRWNSTGISAAPLQVIGKV